MAKKPVDPTLKVSQISEPTASPEGGRASGEKHTKNAGLESVSACEPLNTIEAMSGDVNVERPPASVSIPSGEPRLQIAVRLAWDDAVLQMRETGLLSRLPGFATGDWFYGLIQQKLSGVLKE